MDSKDKFVIKGLIPTIGNISSGKSTFLGALLGTDILEVGNFTKTTEFVLLIKNNKKDEYLFQNISPLEGNYKNGIFKKEGEVTSGSENIKNKIQQLNKEYKNKDIEIDKSIYLLEMPIKNIDNEFLLENYCFMDLPGLDEIDTQEKYINVLEKFGSELIKFEIFIFDSTRIGGDNLINILSKLNKKKCLTKINNLFILNKLDIYKKEKRKEIIDIFYYYLYNTLGDGSLKNSDNKNNDLYINIYKNTFIPMNSLLFKIENILFKEINFSCLLEKELFTYLDEEGIAFSFYDYLKKKLKSITKIFDVIEGETLYLFENEKEEEDIIKDGIDNINMIIEKYTLENGIDIEVEEEEELLKQIYLLSKNNKWRINYSNMFYEIYNFFKDFGKEKSNNGEEADESENLLSKSSNNIELIKEKKIRDTLNNLVEESIKENHEYNQEEEILYKLDQFIKLYEFINNSKIKDEDKKDFKDLTNHINNIKKKLINIKIRVSFFGNIGTGKSSILNCIIGEKILPININQCTYRGIIIRYKDEETFKLYKTKLEQEGSILYYYFKDETNPICEGVKNINSFLKTKNKDINVLDDDAYFILTGRLKFFENIKEEDDEEFYKLKQIIEFIDLPGYNNNANEFKKRGYYDEVLKFTNCCVYVNTPSTIEDTDFNETFKIQYWKNKVYLCNELKEDFVDSCVFVVNKSDDLKYIAKNSKFIKNEKSKISENLIKTIKDADNSEGNKEIKISFFSAKFYEKYIKIYEKYKIFINNNHNSLKLWEKWFENWKLTSGIISLEQYIINDLENDREIMNNIKYEIYYKNNLPQEEELFDSYIKFIKINKIKKFEKIDEIISLIIQMKNILIIYEYLEKIYVFLANDKPYKFWEEMYNEFLKENKNIEFGKFIYYKIQNDKKKLKTKKKKKNEIEKESKIKQNFINKLKNSFYDISLKNKLIINDDEMKNVLDEIYEISEELENESIKYSKSFYIFLKDSIKFSYELQRRNYVSNLRYLWRRIINSESIYDLYNRFKKEKELTINKIVNEYCNKIKTITNPEIEKLIIEDIFQIRRIEYSVSSKIDKLIMDEIEKIKEILKNTERKFSDIEEKRKLESKLKLSNLEESSFISQFGRMETMISKEIEELKIQLEFMLDEINEIIEKNKKFKDLKYCLLKYNNY